MNPEGAKLGVIITPDSSWPLLPVSFNGELFASAASASVLERHSFRSLFAPSTHTLECLHTEGFHGNRSNLN